jgi:predicted alpha-1,6-mannanase (GH76 family)
MTDNTMAQRKNDKQYNGPEKKWQTIQWPREKMTKNGSLDTTEKTKDWVTGTLLRTGGAAPIVTSVMLLM